MHLLSVKDTSSKLSEDTRIHADAGAHQLLSDTDNCFHVVSESLHFLSNRSHGNTGVFRVAYEHNAYADCEQEALILL